MSEKVKKPSSQPETRRPRRGPLVAGAALASVLAGIAGIGVLVSRVDDQPRADFIIEGPVVDDGRTLALRGLVSLRCHEAGELDAVVESEVRLVTEGRGLNGSPRGRTVRAPLRPGFEHCDEALTHVRSNPQLVWEHVAENTGSPFSDFVGHGGRDAGERYAGFIEAAGTEVPVHQFTS